MPKESKNNGWVKLHRSTLEWEWYQDANTFRVFLHCLLSANHKRNKWQGIQIEKGTFITSYKNLAKDLNLSQQQIRTSLDKLILTNEITRKATNKYTVIKIEKWEFYQDLESQDNNQDNNLTNKRITNEQQTDNKQITTNKNEKNEKNEKNDNNLKRKTKKIPPTIQDVKDYCKERKNNIDAEYFIDFYQSKNWMVGKNKMKDWKAAIRTWERNSYNQSDKKADNSSQGNISGVDVDEDEFDWKKRYKDLG